MNNEAGKIISLREEIKSQSSLDDRIADAFEASTSSGDLQALLDEVHRTNVDAQAQSKAAATRALDPKLRPADVATARQQMQDADFRSKRMEAAAVQLQTLLDETKRREDAEARRVAHAEAIAERDQLVKDLSSYEGHAAAIVALLERVAANNQKLHMDEHAERIARGALPEWSVRDDTRLPKLLTMTRLPKFRADGSVDGFMWPAHG